MTSVNNMADKAVRAPYLHTLRRTLLRGLNRFVFKQRAAEAGEVILKQRRVFIVPSRAGLVFVLLLVVLFLGAVNYNLSLGLGFTFLMAGCALIDMHLTFRNLAHLVLSPGRTSPCFCGETGQFSIRLTNRSRHDRYALRIAFLDQAAPPIEQAIDVPAGSAQDLRLGTLSVRRGWLDAPRIRLRTRFPLGLFSAWSYWQPALKVLVYPTPEDDAPPLPLTYTAQREGLGQAGSDDFAGIRPYQAGDSQKQLAWRQIARMSTADATQLVTKQFEGGSAGDCCLDYQQLPASLSGEQRLARLTRWVLEAESAGSPYALRLPSMTIEAALGPAHQAACLMALALCPLPATP